MASRRVGFPVLVAGLLWAAAVSAQMTPDQMAEMILNSARKAYNEKQYPVATARFREFLTKFGGHKDAGIARYGLALTLIEGPDKDYPGALEQLAPLAAVKDFPDQPYVLYYLGAAQRGLGVKLLAQIPAKPQEAPQLRAQANQKFDEAAKQFAIAAAAFYTKAKDPPADAKQLPIELEWASRSLCDQAEMQLRILKIKEAQATVTPFLKGPLALSRYRGLGLYYHGFASFLLGDPANLNSAGRSLTQLAPFTDPIYGTHARYLLARVHHLGDEKAEAAGNYDGALAEYGKQRQQATEAIKNPAQFKDTPDELVRLQELVKGPPPDHIARAAFHLGVLQYEASKFGEAVAKFAAFPQAFPGSPLLIEAQLRQGFCLVQTKDFPNAIKTLQPIVEKEPRLADQALLWIGKAQAGMADPAKLDQYNQALAGALGTMGQAAQRAQQLAATDPEAKARRGEILIEIGDTQQLLKQHKEAANSYEAVLTEKLLPQRDEEVLQRKVTAMHLAADYPGSDKEIARFQQAFPKSSLTPAILFRFAENAYFSALAAEKIPDVNARVKEVARLQEEAGKRYQVVIDKFPEYPHVSLAKFGLGMVHYRKGDFEKSQTILTGIPAPDRTGDLAAVPYVVADCLIRLTPTKADDALQAGKVQEQLGQAADLLDGFISGDPKGPKTADALIKLGLCHQRLAAVLAKPEERNQRYNAARAVYERVMKDFPQDPLRFQAAFERAKVFSASGNKGEAINILRTFAADPNRAAPVAPLAIIQLATLLREQNKPDEAVKVLAEARQAHEPTLAKDPDRSSWIGLMQYHHGVALREFGKFAEARGVFDQVVKTAGARPEGLDASLRLGQCLHQEGVQKIAEARKKLATPGLKPDEAALANKSLEEGWKLVRDSVAYFEGQAEQLKQKLPTADTRARMHYEAAWGHRLLADPEVAVVRTKMQQDLYKKQQDEAAKKDPNYKPPTVVILPEIAPELVPLQPEEQKARAQYQALVAGFPDAPLGVDGRLELAELLSQRNEHDAALKLLSEALDKEPAQELTDKIRLRRGSCFAAKKDWKGALGQFDAVCNNPKAAQLINQEPYRTLIGQAHARAGECLLELGDPAKATLRLAIFRDQGPFQGIPEVSDRALLRLGHAYALANNWDASRQANEILTQRFPQSPWVHEARYGMAWALQNQKQFDPAVNVYQQVIAGTAGEVAAKAQLQTGLCRLEQKRFPEASAALLIVPFTYDYPELNAAALAEAARSYIQLNQKDQAEKLLLRVIKDHPQSKWAEVAKERLEALKKS